MVFDLSKLLRLENLEVTSGMGDMEMALDGWRLPRTRTRVVLRNAALLVEPRLVGHCGSGYGDDTDKGILLEGVNLQSVLQMYP